MDNGHVDNKRLVRRLGLLAATLTGLGVIIGSGIYVILGEASGTAGNAIWMSFLLAAFGAGLTAVSYARLGKLHPRNAPEFQFVSAAFGTTPGFFAGWLMLISQIVSASTVALGFASYLYALTGFPVLAAAIGLIIVSSGIIYLGISQSALVAGILTVVEIIGLLIIIAVGVPDFGNVNYLEMADGWAGIFTGASLVFFAYLGFEGMANLSEEMKDPEKNLPLAILLAFGISALFYVMVALSAVSVLGWEELSSSDAPFVRIAETALGSEAGFVLAFISLSSTGNTALILLLAGSRITHALAKARVLPPVFSTLSRRQHTPWVAIIAIGLLAMALSLFSDIRRVAEFTNFTTLLAFIAVNAGAIRLLTKSDVQNRLVHLLINRLVPLLGIGFSLWLAINAGWRAAVFGLAAIAVGGLIYWLTVLRKKSRKG